MTSRLLLNGSHLIALGLCIASPVSFTGLNDAAASARVSVAKASDVGGSDGGGGGTLPANPVYPYKIRDVLHTAKRDLRMYLNGRHFQHAYSSGWRKSDAKLFSEKKTIFDVLEETDIELQMKKPCLDAYGKEVDASIHASRPKTICLSAARIAPKVTEERYYLETISLLFHELTHLVGATEDEARAFQQDASLEIKGIDERTTYDLAVAYEDGVSRPLNALRKLREERRGLSPQELSKRLDAIASQVFQLDTLAAKNISLMPVDGRGYQHLRFLGEVADLASLYLDDTSAYGAFFGDQTSITYGELLVKRARVSRDRNDFENERITKIQSLEDLDKSLLMIEMALNREDDHANRMVFKMPLFKWSRLPSDGLNQDWRQFAGRWRVTANNCQGEWAQRYRSNLTAIEVYEYQQANGEFTPMLKIVSPGMEANDILGFSTYNVNYWGVSMKGGPGWFKFTSARGDQWDSRIPMDNSVFTQTFKATPSGAQFTRVWTSSTRKDGDDTTTVTTSLDSCHYDLVRE
jgi:hypothetical protein